MWHFLQAITSNEALMAALAAVVAGAAKLFFSNKDLKGEKKTLEDKNARLATFITNDFAMFSAINDIVSYLFEETNADRFLILSANNGTADFNYCTVLFERAEHSEGTRKYVNIALDPPYHSMLKRSESEGPVEIVTEDMPECVLKAYYDMEGVVASQVIFLRRFSLIEGNDKLFYCSIATHNEEGFTTHGKTRINSYAGALQKIIKKWL